MAKKKKSFRGRIGRNSEKKKSEKKGLRYLTLPKGVEEFKPEKGSIKFDIMPYVVTDEHHLDRDDDNGDAVVGDIWWKKPFKVHKNVGINNDTIVCPKTFGKPCPICEEAKRLNDDGEEWEDIKEIFAKDRSLYIIIPIDASKFEEEYKEKPYVFDMSYHLFEKQLDEELGVDEENEVFPNLEGGKTLDVRFREKKFGKKVTFCEAAVIKFEDREEDYEDGYEDDIPNLDEMLSVFSYTQLKSMFFEQADPDEEEDQEFDEVDEEDETPKRKKKTIRKSESEEDIDDNEINPNSGEVMSSRKKPSRKPKPKDDGDDDDKKEEDKPVKKKTSTKKTTRSSKNKCPSGHTYGKDGNEKDECSDCDLWDDCMDEQEKE